MESGDSSVPPHSEHDVWLARGRAVLVRLKLEAEAARAEARRVELEHLLSQADESGKIETLRQWLSSFENTALPVASIGLSVSPHDAKSSTPEVKPAAIGALAKELSWDQLLPQARQNLAQRARALQSAVRSPSTNSLSTKTPPTQKHLTHRTAQLPSATIQTLEQPAPRRVSKGHSDSSKVANKPVHQPRSAKHPSPAQAAAIAPARHKRQPQSPASSNVKPAPAALEPSAKPTFPSRLRSVSASLIAHLLLLLVLAFVTLKLPVPPASLMFQSSTATATETFEISQSAEPTTAEVNEPTEIPELATDLSETFDSLTTDLSATLASTQIAPTAATASAVSSAVAAAQSASSLTAAAVAGGSFFGAQASGNCFCYIIDSSGSMRGGAWEAAKAELSRSLDTLTANQRFYIIFFNNKLDLMPNAGEVEPAPNPIYATPENIQHAKRWIDTIRIATGAPPNDALTAAIELEADAIYLLTDGVTKVDVCAHLQQVNRITDLINGELVKTPIHAIAYYSDKGEQLMRQVAAENKGQFIYVPKPK